MSDRSKIKVWFQPLSSLYGLGVWLRNKFFDWNLLRSKEFPIPVISVGNLAVGGTGKTPHIEFLIGILSKRYRVAVLSRGYKRKTSGFILANEHSTDKTIGDEPYQIYRKYPEIIVAVDADRRNGIKKLLELSEDRRPQVILLDDAFQHRYVHPSYSILLTDSARPYYEDHLLPKGRLREPKSSAERANTIIVTKCPKILKPIDFRIIEKNLDLFPYQHLYFTGYKYKSLVPVFPESTEIKKESLERVKVDKYSLLLVAGIANPRPLIEHLKEYTQTLDTLIYPDHHHFSRKDIDIISSRLKSLSGEKKIIITTEKDAVRLMNDPAVSDEMKPYLFYLPVEVEFKLDNIESFKQDIYDHVENVKRDHILA